MRRISVASVVSLVIAVVLLCSCVERKEHLKISPEGRVVHRVTHESESLGDLYEGDAVPMIAGGWLVERQEEKKSVVPVRKQGQADADEPENDTIHRLVAETVFPPGSDLPANFALTTDLDADLYLQFPTSLTIEQRADGVYYHFARTYSARPWAQVELLRAMYLESPLEEIKGIDPHQWTPGHRIRVVEAIVNFEVHKMLFLAREAFKATTPEFAQDAWLGVRRSMIECVAALDYPTLAKLLEPKDNPIDERRRTEAMEEQQRQFREKLTEHLKDALRSEAGYGGSQVQRFLREFDRRGKELDITEDLADDHFTITIEMPGEIIAHNANEIQAGGKAVWTLGGEMFRDREIELMVTSRVVE